MISNMLKTEPVPAAEVNSSVPLPVSKVISRCLQKDRSDRPRSMKRVGALLTEAISRSGGMSSAGSFARRLYHESRSSNIWLRIVGAALVVVLALAGWFYFSRRGTEPPFNFANMTIRRLSDTNNVGFSLLAPDGKAVVFATFDDEAGTRTLWIRRLDDRNALQLVPPNIWAYWGGLAMSEDGGQVFYLTAERTAAHGSLYRVSSLGGPSRKIVETANDVGGISPDGQRILFVRYSEPSQIVAVNTSDGGNEQAILTAPETPLQTNFRDPQFSPDGKSVYFIRVQRIDGIEYWSLEMIDLGSGRVEQILRQRERIAELAPLRDGTGILVTAIDPSSNLQQIYHVSLPDGEMTRVTNDLATYFGVSVDREGRNIVASQRFDEQRVWVGDANNLQALKPLNKEPNAHRNVEWTPDGRIVYDAYENNRTDIWIADADGKNLQRLTTGDFDDSEPRVSGDGRYIVFTSTRAGFNQVWRMNIDGGNQVLLADVPGQTQTPRFAADGSTVVFSWLRERERVLAKVPVTGGNVEVMQDFAGIPVFSPYFWAMSPDGKNVAYSVTDKANGQTKVAVRPVDSTEPSKILDIWPSLIFEWMPDGQSIYYRERQLGYVPENEIRVVDIASSKPKVLLSVMPEYIVDLTYSPDGKKAAVVRGKSSSNSVLLTTSKVNN
jgi:Tol biopolymer transport system component